MKRGRLRTHRAVDGQQYLGQQPLGAGAVATLDAERESEQDIGERQSREQLMAWHDSRQVLQHRGSERIGWIICPDEGDGRGTFKPFDESTPFDVFADECRVSDEPWPMTLESAVRDTLGL